MINIEVITCNELPLSQPLSAEFDEQGGNIGRAEGNTLVLHDPGKSISRIHASIICRGGRYFIRGLGSTLPVYLNEQPLSNGQDTAIDEGDTIQIGDYAMQVVAGHGNSIDHGSSMQHSLAPSNGHAEHQSLTELLAFPSGGALQNPVALKGKTPEVKSLNDLDPFGIKATPASRQMSPPDSDPFADLSYTSNKLPELTPSVGHKFSDELDPVLEPKKRYENIDDVINPGNPLMDLPGSVAANSVDPLIVLENSPGKAAIHPVQRDDTPEFQAALSPVHVQKESREMPPVIDQPVPAGKSFSDHEELLHAFLVGAGISNPDKPIELTPQLMNLIGQLLRESTQGTLDLLLARGMMKREMRAEVTMIKPRENNPLKYSPSVEVALTHLLALKGKEQGFMTPLQAMRDACNDLRSHQFGFMAGMRAALSGILERFNPNQLEKRLAQKKLIDSVFSLNRRAKLWDLFTERYSDISHEAEEDFHVMFGKEFLRAYEAQIAKFEKDDGKR